MSARNNPPPRGKKAQGTAEQNVGPDGRTLLAITGSTHAAHGRAFADISTLLGPGGNALIEWKISVSAPKASMPTTIARH